MASPNNPINSGSFDKEILTTKDLATILRSNQADIVFFKAQLSIANDKV
jgi:hypothetical protein